MFLNVAALVTTPGVVAGFILVLRTVEHVVGAVDDHDGLLRGPVLVALHAALASSLEGLCTSTSIRYYKEYLGRESAFKPRRPPLSPLDSRCARRCRRHRSR